MNRQARRASKGRPDHRMPADLYRVPHGHVALTFDLAGRAPSTISIRADALVSVLDGVAKLVAGRSYQQSVHLLGAVIRAADEGVANAWSGAILGYWLAVNHPAGGPEMAARLSDEIAVAGRAHITLHVGPGGIGLTFGLSQRFVDLDHVSARAREAGIGTFVAAEPRRQRPGGRA
jgi:hypothetical protein